MPNSDLVIGGRSGRLFDLVYTGGWSLLGFSGLGAAADIQAVHRALDVFDLPSVRRTLISADADATAEAYDLDERAHRALSLSRPMLYLVRPDGYVAARGRPETARQMLDHARRWTRPAAVGFARPLSGSPPPLNAEAA